ncbi:MAG: methylated-DNA--[protein]-cysteine S-methyltransferase [Bacteroidales bacterium]|nr:methylated-DNA--[protein]-cysteine S-methyltransferase [Bacteroidales bacterium]
MKDSDRQWIVTRIDGKIASVSTDYRSAARILTGLSSQPPSRFGEITCTKVTTEEIFALSDRVEWEDLMLFGTPFQKTVWRRIFGITHPGTPRLLSYTDLAEELGKAPGVRAVAHAVGLNPVSVIIPCHLIIPKESLERLNELGESSLFKWETLYMVDRYIDYGEYALGDDLKRELILQHMNR